MTLSTVNEAGFDRIALSGAEDAKTTALPCSCGAGKR